MPVTECKSIRVERRSTLTGARQAASIVVVIDVLRAFTCAAMMFSYGIRKLVLVGNTEEALDLRRADPEYVVAGEVNGAKPDGFDIGNSPSEIIEKGESYFKQRKVVLRSSAGTQGALAVRYGAREIIVASYSTASAVARYIRHRRASDPVTLVGMGWKALEKSVEDERCGDYIEHLLTGREYDHISAIRDCLHDPAIAASLRGERPYLPKEDVILALQRDLFDFVMVGQPAANSVVVRSIRA